MSTKESDHIREAERIMGIALAADGGVFLLFLLFSGLGVTWMKVLLAIVSILISGLGLGFLYLTHQLSRRRTRYLTVGYAAVLVCLLVSLLLHYPSPAPALPGASAAVFMRFCL